MNPTRFGLYAAVAGGLAVLTSLAQLQAMDGHAHEHPHASADEAHRHGHGATHGAAQAALAIQPQAGARTALTLTLTDEAGEPIQELITHHARKLHVVIISDDMQVIGHVHPHDFGEPIEDGRAKVYFTFPRAGRYLVAADFLTEAGPHAAQFLVEVAGPDEPPAAETGPAAGVAVVEMEEDDRAVDSVVLSDADQADGYDVSVVRPQAIKAGEPATFVFRIAAKGAPVTELRPYLDAPLHLAIVKDDLTEFLHEHGTVASETQAGYDLHGSHGSHDHAHDSGDHGHPRHGYQGPATFGPELTATVSFPEPGRYYLFGQAAHGNRLLISRLPIEVR